MVLNRGAPQSPRSKAGAKWLSKIRKGQVQVAPKGLHAHLCLIKLTEKKFFSIFYKCFVSESKFKYFDGVRAKSMC